MAGPPPGGGIVSGMIWGRELETLDQDVARLSATDLSSPLVCQSPQVLPGVQDRVVLNDGQQRDFVIFEGSSAALHGSDCTAGDPVKAEKLHADLHALMKEYYPVPFPRGGVVKAGPAPGSS